MADSGPLTQDQALALLTRTSDEGWLTTELSGPDGTAAINARTAIAAATSQALMDQAKGFLDTQRERAGDLEAFALGERQRAGAPADQRP